ncbi:MAG: DUF5106 domain-containing protein [Muribaculaceae bacterium]|nr:DUF5106 domain-containing protein [Muribaculaceae bacterium]
MSATHLSGSFVIIITSLLSVIIGCSGSKAEKSDRVTEESSPIVAFCRAIDYTDTVSLHNDKKMQATMTDIVKLMLKSDSIEIDKGLRYFFDGLNGDKKSLGLAFHYADLYLRDPQSPVKNGKLYLQFLQFLLQTPDLPEAMSEKAKEEMRTTKLNLEGSTANDFRYIDRNGNTGSLHAISARHTMLIFYDPECPHCPEILKKIANDRGANRAIDSGDLMVLAVYAEGKRDVWEKTKHELPQNWTVAYDLTGVLDADLYDLPAMPIVYLLDADKTVVIKDMPW